MLRTHNSTGRRLNPEERRRSKDGKYNRRTLADFEHGCFLPCVIQTRGRLRCVLRCGPCAFGASSTLRLLLWPNPPIIFSIGGTLPWVKVPPSSSFSVLPCLFLPLPFSVFLRLAVSFSFSYSFLLASFLSFIFVLAVIFSCPRPSKISSSALAPSVASPLRSAHSLRLECAACGAFSLRRNLQRWSPPP